MRRFGGPGRRMRRSAAVGLAAGALVVGVAAPAHADEASSFGVNVNVTLLGSPAVSVGPLAQSAVGSSPNSLASISVPGVLSTGVVNTTATGDPATGGFASSASVTNPSVSLLGAIGLTAGVVEATCTATQAGNTGAVDLTGLAANVLGIPVVIPVTPAANTTISLNLAGIPIATLTLNEQIVNPDGGLTVNAIHLELLGGVLGSIGTGDIVISSATCGPAELPVPLAHGAGLVLGIGIVGVAGAGILGVVTVRRRRAAGPIAA